MITKQDFCDCELKYFCGDDAKFVSEQFFNWLKKKDVITYSAQYGWRWNESSDLCPGETLDVIELLEDFYPSFKETA